MPTDDVACASRLIAAPAAEVFELLATPAQHHLIDGSGSVRGALTGSPRRLSPGARFQMSMRIVAPYRIRNTVVEFEEGRLIAWRHFGGHVWRYRLDPVDDTRTMVTEEFDPTTSRSPLLLRVMDAGRRNQRSIEQTLDRLEQWAVTRPAPQSDRD